MAAVMIGVDPHKGSHTAVEIGPAEEPLGELRVLRRTEDPRRGGNAVLTGRCGREPARLEFSCIGCVGRMEMAGCHVHGVSIAAARQVHAFRPQLKLRLPVPWAP